MRFRGGRPERRISQILPAIQKPDPVIAQENILRTGKSWHKYSYHGQDLDRTPGPGRLKKRHFTVTGNAYRSKEGAMQTRVFH